jgi:hypothetical protein
LRVSSLFGLRARFLDLLASRFLEFVTGGTAALALDGSHPSQVVSHLATEALQLTPIRARDLIAQECVACLTPTGVGVDALRDPEGDPEIGIGYLFIEAHAAEDSE